MEFVEQSSHTTFAYFYLDSAPFGYSFSNQVCLAAREVMLRIVKLLRSEMPAGVRDTLNFTSCVSTILHSGIAAASPSAARLH